MKTRLTENQWQAEGGTGPERRPCASAPTRLGACPTCTRVNLWEQGHLAATLTTQSGASHSGIPILRVQDPTYHDSIDLEPAEFAPCREDDLPETAAELLVHIHARRPLTGEALDCARRFLKQWPDGPQLPEEGGVPARDGSLRLEDRPEYPLAA